MQFGISECIAFWGQYRGDAIAVESNGRTVTYRQLNVAIDYVAARASGFKGERVGVLTETRLEYLVLLMGVVRSGKSVVLLNPGLSASALRTNIMDTELEYVLHDVRFRKNITSGCPVEIQPVDLDQALDASQNLPPSLFEPNEAHDEWGVFFSSGTTGIPKAIERDHESVVTELIGWCLELGLTRGTRFYIGRPVYYTGGLVLTLAALMVRGTAILNDYPENNFDAALLDFATMCRTPLDLAFFVPDQVRLFMQRGQHIERCPRLLLMGAPITGQEKVQVARHFNTSVIESWGNSESLGTITEPDDLVSRPGSIGRPFLADEMCVTSESGEVLGTNEIGLISGGEEGGFLRYSGRPEATLRARQRGLIISEDVGYRDVDGYFYIIGRQQDAVIRNGETIYLSSIELKVRMLVPERSCAISALNSEAGAVLLVAAVSGAEPLPANLLHGVNENLSGSEKLDRLVHLETLPRLPSGKIDRLALGRLIESLLVNE